MKDRAKHIILSIILSLCGHSIAQNMTLVVPTDFVISGNTYTMKNGDEIQFYYDSSGTKLAFAASQVWTGADLTFVLPRNSATTGQNGYNSGQHLYFKILDKPNSCKVIYNAAYTKKNGTGLNTFVPGRVDTLTMVNLEIYDLGISANSDTLCTADTVQLQGGGSLIDPYPPYASFSTNPSSGLNFTNGKVIYQGSTPGTYSITLNYRDYCIAGNNLPVTILPPLSLSNSDIILSENACGKNNGMIQVLMPSGAYQPTNYTFSQNNTVLNSNSLGILSNIGDGAYDVKVSDKYGCEVNTSVNLSCIAAAADMTLTIPNVFNFKNYTVKNLDLFEIYYDSLGQKLKFVTAQYWQGTDMIFTLPANYATTGKNGFNENDKIYIKIYDEVNNCRLEVASLITDLSAGLFSAGSSQTATNISGGLAQALYPQDSLCTGTSTILFIGKEDPYSLPPTYSTSLSGLDLASDGTVTHENSLSGTYTIDVITNLCITSKNTAITILPEWLLSTANILLKENDCGQPNGSIKLIAPSAAYQPLTYSFVSTSYSYTGSVDSIANISDENFNISVTDRYQCSAQTVFSFNCKTVSNTDMALTISNKYEFQTYTIKSGDEVELYYDSLGVKLALADKLVWNNNDLTFILHKNNAIIGKNGFEEGEIIYAKIHDVQNNCRIQVFSVIVADSIVKFKSGISATTSVVTGNYAQISYVTDTLCANISIPKIGNFADPYAPFPKLESIPNGLGFLSDGSVDYQTSSVGSYLIKVNHPNCFLQNGAIPFEILPQIIFTPQDVIVKENECGKLNGVVKIVAPSSAYRPVTYSYAKRNSSKAYSGPLDSLDGLDEGQYLLRIDDKYSCVGTTAVSFTCIPPYTTPATNISNNSFILTDLNPNNSSIVFDCDKTITVLNSVGKLVKKLQANEVWTGNDADGKSLPTGLYIVYCDKTRLGELTIIR